MFLLWCLEVALTLEGIFVYFFNIYPVPRRVPGICDNSLIYIYWKNECYILKNLDVYLAFELIIITFRAGNAQNWKLERLAYLFN